MRILFVCLGNICRSPLAEGIFKKLAADEGLGYLQLLASSEFNSPLNFSALVFIAAMGVFLFYAVHLAERLFIRHR